MKEERNLNICSWNWFWDKISQHCTKEFLQKRSRVWEQNTKNPTNLAIHYIINCVIHRSSILSIWSLLWSFYEGFCLSPELVTILSLLRYESCHMAHAEEHVEFAERGFSMAGPPRSPVRLAFRAQERCRDCSGSDRRYSMPSHAWFKMLHC